MGDMWIATEPRCPTHGKMKWIHPSHPIGGGYEVLDASYWICHGFDGEGCDHRVEAADMNWTRIGTEHFEFRVGTPVLLRARGKWEETAPYPGKFEQKATDSGNQPDIP